ncbi:N-acetylmuramoyl-L-alanine amidase [Neobacillus sp. 114]|uniref:N-acetylmuramoyl-L-alanine amidase n=1 Tax=Neobacillus sp. 114 TaxID=3048535 RepID=UPI0024C23990|nr:N-acetylmuramoyl-L-alanine amidase [Neobacillus sp. 114]
MHRKIFLLFVVLLIFISLLPNRSNANGLDSINSGTSDEVSSYFVIHYNGESQEAVLNENVTLTLSGWTDETKSSVNGKINIHTESINQTEDITIDATNHLKEITVPEKESIYYRLEDSDTFKVEEVTNEQMTTGEQNNSVIPTSEAPTVSPISEAPAVISEGNAEEVVNIYSTQSEVENPSVRYATHVQDIGWQNAVSNGELSGTAGQAKRLESIKISIDNVQDLGVKYSTHVQDHGWLASVTDGKESGTTGEAKRLEAIKIELTGSKAQNYDIYYRVHAQDFGWLGWAKNGESAGTEGFAKRLEAIEIVLVPKGGEAPGSIEQAFVKNISVVYSTHVETYGWLNNVKNGAMSGTQGQGKRMEAIKITLPDAPYSGEIIYSTHVQDYGWLNNVSNGEVSGTSGQSKRLEAIKIGLTGEIANYYDVYYRVHAQDYGWLGWAKNGMKAGTEGRSKRLEAIEIKLVPKGQGEPVSEKAAFKQQGFTVFLDPGHGGTDPGATSVGYRESDLNLAVAKKVQSLLLNRGYTVYMSRNGDTSVELLDRSKMANNLNTDIFVSIHTNSSGTTSTSVNGIESYFYEIDPTYPSKINAGMATNPDRIAKSMQLANLIQEKMIAYTGATNRGTDGADFSVVRESAMPATLLEIGFINNSSERQKLFTDSYQDILAKSIVDGIDQYFDMY